AWCWSGTQACWAGCGACGGAWWATAARRPRWCPPWSWAGDRRRRRRGSKPCGRCAWRCPAAVWFPASRRWPSAVRASCPRRASRRPTRWGPWPRLWFGERGARLGRRVGRRVGRRPAIPPPPPTTPRWRRWQRRCAAGCRPPRGGGRPRGWPPPWPCAPGRRAAM
ncbi:hypothetical protein APUTEX25_002157, partial [Auxenochlorella protothecoides]